MRYFANITTVEELKKSFRALCQSLHPDKGGDPAEFKTMMAEYTEALKRVGAGKPEAVFVDEWAEFKKTARTEYNGQNIKVGDRVQCYNLFDKCNTLQEAFYCFLRYSDGEKSPVFGEVEAVVYMTDEEVHSFSWMDAKPAGTGNGGTWGPIYDSEKSVHDSYFGYRKEEHAHYYDMLTAIVTPSYMFFIDCQGYDYARYFIAPVNFESMPDYKAAAEKLAAEKAEEERKQREAEKACKARDLAAVQKWAEVLKVLPELPKYDYNNRKEYQKAEAARKNAFKHNIKVIFNTYFPGVKVTVSDTSKRYSESSEISWVDGPTVEEVEKVKEWAQFLKWYYYKEDVYDDYSTRANYSEFETFREKFGHWSDDTIKFTRTLSAGEMAKAEAKAVELVPQLAEPEAMETYCGAGVTVSYEEGEKIAHYFGKCPYYGVDWSTLSEDEREKLQQLSDELSEKREYIHRFMTSDNRYNEHITKADFMRYFAEFWEVEKEPRQKRTRKAEPAQAEPVAEDAEKVEPVEGVELVTVDAEHFAVIGDTYPLRKKLRTLGGWWDKRKKRWQFFNDQRAEVVAALGIAEDAEPVAEPAEDVEPQAEPTAEPEPVAEDAEKVEPVEISAACAGAVVDFFLTCKGLFADSEPMKEPTADSKPTAEPEAVRSGKIVFSADDCPELDELKTA